MSRSYAPPPRGGFKLYGADISLYSGKLRSYLRKKGIPFTEQAATYHCYKHFILPRTGVQFIPVLQTADDVVWQDTTEIIDRLEVMYPAHPVVPQTSKQQVAAHVLEMFADQWLLMMALHTRWQASRTSLREIWLGFGQLLLPGWPVFMQRFMGKRISARFRNFQPLLGIRPEAYQAITAQGEQLVAVLDAHFSACPYLLGDRPCVADYALVGVFYAHIYRDLDSGRQLRAKAPSVVRWVEDMMRDEVATGDWLADDEVPASLDWLFAVVADEVTPVMLCTAESLHQWQQINRANQVPRVLAEHDFIINGVQSQRKIMSHAQYMLQRSTAAYAQQQNNPALQDWIQHQRLVDLLTYPIKTPIKRSNNRFVFA